MRLWHLRETNFTADRQNHYETLFAVGNGYLTTRGTFEEGHEGEIAATLVHGIYNHAPNTLVPELVNAPNPLPIRIRMDGTSVYPIMRVRPEDYMRPPQGLVIGYERSLNLYTATLRRELLFRAASGNIARIVFERFASLHDQHVI
ncbi:MAG: beta-phosphoglucomutase, partial [Blastochloris sp.]|nr:beta-phosphoglucomutase [Blastochloris sp.]